MSHLGLWLRFCCVLWLWFYCALWSLCVMVAVAVVTVVTVCCGCDRAVVRWQPVHRSSRVLLHRRHDQRIRSRVQSRAVQRRRRDPVRAV